jgi:anti-sigma regulatory factor (Ser/Thr protein kinase)
MALGASHASTYSSQAIPVPAGSTLVLYTDGLVERRGSSIDEGLERLRALSERLDDVERWCADAVDTMLADEPQDDIAVVAARLPPLADDLRTTWPARPEALVAVRHLLRRWLRAHGASEHETYDILVACQEACANAIEHAYGPGRAHFEVDASHRDARICVTVRDRGRWREPRGTHRGRGIALMRSLMQHVDVEHGERGTVVVLERTLAPADAA